MLCPRSVLDVISRSPYAGLRSGVAIVCENTTIKSQEPACGMKDEDSALVGTTGNGSRHPGR